MKEGNVQKTGFLQDSNGNNSSKRLWATIFGILLIFLICSYAFLAVEESKPFEFTIWASGILFALLFGLCTIENIKSLIQTIKGIPDRE
jgi:quinol-cytochrome oxidoreductase complex cytochrome b subunit